MTLKVEYAGKKKAKKLVMALPKFDKYKIIRNINMPVVKITDGWVFNFLENYSILEFFKYFPNPSFYK